MTDTEVSAVVGGAGPSGHPDPHLVVQQFGHSGRPLGVRTV